MFAMAEATPPVGVRPLIAFGAMTVILMTLTQLVGNQFGFDRGGFRIFVLCPAPRRDILLGKNLAVAPLALGMGLAVTILLEVIFPMRIDHLLALPIQFVTMFLLYCVLANFLAIFVPIPVAATSMKPVQWKTVPVLLHLAFVPVLTFTLALTLLPLGIEFLVEQLAGLEGIPIALGLLALECAVIVWVYRAVLAWQGALLQAREQKILEVVTTKAE
jgi:hypothetical protein